MLGLNFVRGAEPLENARHERAAFSWWAREGLLMRALLTWVGRFAGLLGVALIILAAGERLAGAYWLGGFQVGTILQAGMASTLVACLGYAAALAEWPSR